MPHLPSHFSLPLCSSVSPGLALCNTCSPVFHTTLVVTCLSVILASHAGLASSCPCRSLNQAGANWRAKRTAWGESVWRSNWRQRWDRKTTWRAERNRKHTGMEEQCGTVWSELRTALICASQIAGITQKRGKYTFVQICSEFSGSTLLRTDRDQQWAALDWLLYALSLKWMCAFYYLLISHVEQRNRGKKKKSFSEYKK